MKEGIQNVFMSKRREKASELNQEMHNADFHRLARRILGKSIALVLGGGGSRGITHLGVLKAFEERHIPVDIIGGTSIGAFIGTAYARQPSFVAIFDKLKAVCLDLPMRKFIFDVTYPWIAITSGHRLNKLVRNLFGDIDMQDTWLESYCAVTNLSKNVSPTLLNHRVRLESLEYFLIHV